MNMLHLDLSSSTRNVVNPFNNNRLLVNDYVQELDKEEESSSENGNIGGYNKVNTKRSVLDSQAREIV
jgi:hypothetical protein